MVIAHVTNFLKTKNKAVFVKIIKYVTVTVPPIILLTKYKIDEDFQKHITSSFGGGQRFCRSMIVGCKISLDYWYTINVQLRKYSEESIYYDALMSCCHQRAANAIYKTAIKNGGVYIKLGQGLCSMNQLLPKEYPTILSQLEDKALQYRSQDVDAIFKEEFNILPKEMFKEFDYNPVAAASLAMVFKALDYEGRKLAVKVQYVDLRNRFESDIWCSQVLLKIVEWVHPNFGFSWVLENLKHTLAKELDFENEAKNSEICKDHLKKFDFITVPKVYWDKTTKRIMTADWYDGYKINDTKNIERVGLSMSDIAEKLIKAFGEQIFVTGFIHADPHPGNVLVAPKHTNSSKAQLIILDHGLYEILSKRERKCLCFLWKSIVEKNEKDMKNYSLHLGIPEGDYFTFCEMLIMRPIKMNFNFTLGGSMTLKDQQYMLKMAAQRFDEIMNCLKLMPQSMILVFRNLNTVRSINQILHSPVNRYSILAKSALVGLLENNEKANTVTGKINLKLQILRYNLYLSMERIKMWWITHFLKLIQKLSFNKNLLPIIQELES